MAVLVRIGRVALERTKPVIVRHVVRYESNDEIVLEDSAQSQKLGRRPAFLAMSDCLAGNRSGRLHADRRIEVKLQHSL